MKSSYQIKTADDMEALGAELAALIMPGAILLLKGELGAGKTTLVRGFLRALGHQGAVKSPTYTIVEPYELTDVCVHHFDLYRLHDFSELEAMGFQDYLTSDAICLIEWPELVAAHLPGEVIYCTISIEPNGRLVKLSSLRGTK